MSSTDPPSNSDLASHSELTSNDDDFRTQVWHGLIEYGEFSARNWFGIGGVEHPIIRVMLSEISKVSNIDQFDLYLTGGILESWVTWDLDLVLVGDHEVSPVRQVMRDAVAIGFEYHFYVDIHYQSEPVGLDGTPVPEVGKIDYWGYEITDFFRKNGVVRKLDYQKVEEGLYRRTLCFPYDKVRKKMAEGHVYQPAQRLITRQNSTFGA